MAHAFLLYAPEDQDFAHQLAVQLQQRGLVIWPVPDPNVVETGPLPDAEAGFGAASHYLGIISPEGIASETLQEQCRAALATGKPVIALMRHAVELPAHLAQCAVVDFDEPFLLAVESLVKRLAAAKAPTRPLTIEHPPLVSKPELLPIALPSERCWRDDRLRINYNLPVILTPEEMELRIPAFLAQTRFELDKSTRKEIRGVRMREFKWFDPRRAHQTITVKRRQGGLRVYYRMTRVQVYHWFPAHYYTLNREAAALYRYLVIGQLDSALLEPVRRQARRARLMSWAAVWALVLAPLAILALLLL